MGSSEGQASLISFCSDVPASLISFCCHPNPKPYTMITLTLTLILLLTQTLTKECADLILMHQMWRLQMCFDILGMYVRLMVLRSGMKSCLAWLFSWDWHSREDTAEKTPPPRKQSREDRTEKDGTEMPDHPTGENRPPEKIDRSERERRKGGFCGWLLEYNVLHLLFPLTLNSNPNPNPTNPEHHLKDGHKSVQTPDSVSRHRRGSISCLALPCLVFVHCMPSPILEARLEVVLLYRLWPAFGFHD